MQTDEATVSHTAPHGRGAHANLPGALLTSAEWYALRLRSRFEFAVRDALRAAGVEEFLPTYGEEIRRADRTQLNTRPLFAGYIFARFVADGGNATVLRTRGVVEILGVAGVPTAIPDAEIESLRQLQRMQAQWSAAPAHAAGETVTIARGPFAGVVGEVTRTQGAARLTVAIEILGRAVSVAIDAADVD